MSLNHLRLIALLPLLAAAPASAVITSGVLTSGTVFTRGGNFIVIGNPAGLGVGLNNFDDNNVRAFNERQNYTLGSALLTDVGGSIAGGSVVDSHYLVFDPARNQTVEGSASFRTRVLGIVYNDGRLLGSDWLGAPGVTYFNPSGRGLEPPVDVIGFAGNTVNFSLSGSNPGDTFRVITAGYVPEPATWAMLAIGFGMVGAGLRRSRRAFGAA